ncbi:MAG: tyrosine-type recombinase/integrase [Hespellia sp.]|nr:tyrosine-type recombinase/integrase [Hespellia sp.]
MEQKILEVLRRMQTVIPEEGLQELKCVLNMVLGGCELAENMEVMVVDKTWVNDMEDFLISKELEGKSKKTIDRYRYELNRLLSYVNKRISDIVPGDISEYMRMYKMIRKISNATLKNVRAVYSSFFVWLRDRDRIRKNPMILVEEVKVEYKLQNPFSDEERRLLLRNCKTIRDKAMMEFLYSTAVRVSELTALNRADVRFASKDLIVFGKGAKERVVYLNDISNMYMKEYLQSRDDDNPALFVSENAPNQRLTKNGIEDIIRRTGRRAGVTKAHPHRFRRTAITNATNRGMTLQEAMIMAGHSKPETTMRYCTVDQAGVKYHHQKYLSA